jgi:hypothetical protein
MIFQLQNENTPCIEIVFEAVSDLTVNLNVNFGDSSGIVDDIGIQFTIVPGHAYIHAEKMRYRLPGKGALGKDLQTVKEIPYGDISNARFLEDEDDWIKCTECMNIWQEKEVKEFVKCPECNANYWDIREDK